MGSHLLMAGFRNLEKTISDSSWSCSMWIKGQALESQIVYDQIPGHFLLSLPFPSFLVCKMRVIPAAQVVYEGRWSLVVMPNLMSRIVKRKPNLLTCQARRLPTPVRND